MIKTIISLRLNTTFSIVLGTVAGIFGITLTFQLLILCLIVLVIKRENVITFFLTLSILFTCIVGFITIMISALLPLRRIKKIFL